jgi:hypothetical protein
MMRIWDMMTIGAGDTTPLIFVALKIREGLRGLLTKKERIIEAEKAQVAEMDSKNKEMLFIKLNNLYQLVRLFPMLKLVHAWTKFLTPVMVDRLNLMVDRILIPYVELSKLTTPSDEETNIVAEAVGMIVGSVQKMIEFNAEEAKVKAAIEKIVDNKMKENKVEAYRNEIKYNAQRLTVLKGVQRV